mgnify:CR=1 FL=1
MKRTTTVYVDSELVERAKAAGINISRFLERCLEEALREIDNEGFLKRIRRFSKKH